jgi:hypothetical protein
MPYSTQQNQYIHTLEALVKTLVRSIHDELADTNSHLLQIALAADGILNANQSYHTNYRQWEKEN